MAFAQMNVKIEPEWIDEIDEIADQHDWSRTQAIRVAIRTLGDVMSKHEDAPRRAMPDMQELYARVSEEIPGQLVEVSRSVEFRYVGEIPVIACEGWILWEDDATGELLAREEAGEQRFGRIRNGRIQAMISPAIASQN